MEVSHHLATIIVTQASSLMNCPVFGDEKGTVTNIRDGLARPFKGLSLSVPTLLLSKINAVHRGKSNVRLKGFPSVMSKDFPSVMSRDAEWDVDEIVLF